MWLFFLQLHIVYAQWSNGVIELLVWLLICCVLIKLPCGYWTNKKKKCVRKCESCSQNNSSPQVVWHSQAKWNVLFCFQQCLSSQFTWFFCLFLLLFLFFVFIIIILLYFILLIFLYFTTHIFVTLIKDYKIYLVAKRPQKAC